MRGTCTTCPVGQGLFLRQRKGHVRSIRPRIPHRPIDMKELVDRLQLRGIDLPILLRFTGILKHRLGEIHDALQPGDQGARLQGQLLLRLSDQGQPAAARRRGDRAISASHIGFGLEAGSKPELLAVVAMTDADTPIICNGFKDAEFIEMAMLAQKIGRNIIPVVEKYTELELILKYAEKIGVRPQIGMRVKLAARGSGRWQSSGGYRSQVRPDGERNPARALKSSRARHAGLLQAAALPPGQPDHEHPHDQRRAATKRPACMPSWPSAAPGCEYLDVGGGLGVDYDGSQTNFESSVNYTLQEYANDVVYHVQSVCDEAGVPHPTIISESGRAVVAYHSAWCSACWASRSQANDDDIPPTIAADVGTAAASTCSTRIRTSPCATCWKAITTPSRRWTWR